MGLTRDSQGPVDSQPSDVPPERLCKLPVFRPVAVRLLAELAKEDAEIAHVTDLLNSDPAFSAEILTLANSSLFARHTRIDTVQRAIILLGLERTRALAATVALHGMVSGIKDKDSIQACWRHSRATAIVSECLAPFYGLTPDQAYTTGLMHDIGRLGMLSAYPEYPALLAMAVGGTEDLLKQERESFSVDHCQAGLWLTRIWRLPEEFWETSSHHHSAVTGTLGDRTDLVRLGCLFAQALGYKAAPQIECEPTEALIEQIPQGVRARSRFSLEQLCERLNEELPESSSW